LSKFFHSNNNAAFSEQHHNPHNEYRNPGCLSYEYDGCD
jgi:hypothetical protein